ncbi:hypothetical protein OG883_45260 [Streptomyces sp. NBC_01142]|uniref:hypothetical protein n=1 Tax=Streptomyces sp. NBC_01142 TaxID=2975865 RepID=UPI002252A7FF|nr:hypothetical protein [Streptomyces sp. NBC_01142]MCX4826849.1 hypothetical protein [Streptomyces sp. NBC_01142]
MLLTPTAVPSPAPSTAATTSPPAAPVPEQGSGAGVLTATVLSGVFLAALIAAAINIWQARRKSREEERNRLSTAFAEAFATYSAYNQLPYAIRRRRQDQTAEERIRLSETLREIQTKLAYHQAWTEVEAPAVGKAYAELLQHMRQTSGRAMHDAWKAPAITSDDAMNIPPTVIDLSPLKPYEQAYLDAVRTHLDALTPWWGR